MILLRKNQGFIILVLILGVFIIGLASVILTIPLETVYNTNYNLTELQEPDYQLFFIRAKTIWSWMLFPIAIILILWTTRMILKKTDYNG